MGEGFRFSTSCIVFLALLFLFGCKKDEDRTAPQVVIELPAENSVYSVYDPIPIVVEVMDDKVVESVEITLYSKYENRKVGKTQSYSIGTDKYRLEAKYAISDTLLPTGAYYIRIHAFDGNNIGYAFQTINILALAREQLFTVVLTSYQNASYTTVYELNGDNSYSNIFDFGFAHSFSAVSSREKILYITDNSSNEIEAFDIANKSIKWTKDYPAPSSTQVINFLSLSHNGMDAAISIQNGYVEILSPEGSVKRNYYTETGMFPQRHFITEELSFLESYSNNRSVHQLEIFLTAFSGSFDNLSIDFDVVGVFRKDENHYYFIANQNGTAKLFKYSSQSKSLSTVDELLSNPIHEVVSINSDELVFASGSTVYKYSISSGSTFVFASGVTAKSIAYEPLANELYLSAGNQLRIYNVSSGTLKTFVNFPSDIQEIFPVYNY